MKRTPRRARGYPIRFVWLLACGLLAGFAAPPGHAEPELQNRFVGTWLLQTFRGPELGCRVLTHGNQDIMLGFFYDRAAGFYIRLEHRADAWHLKANDRYSVAYQVDDQPAVEKEARSLKDTVVIMLDDDPASLAPFRKGRVLQIHAARQVFTLTLRGSDPALQALEDCARDIGHGAVAKVDPFAADGGGAPGDPGPAASSQPSAEPLDTENEALLAGVLILNNAALGGYAVPLDEASDGWMDAYDASWKLPDATAGVLMLPLIDEGQVEEFFTLLAKTLSDACPGQYRVERPKAEAADVVGRLQFYCGTQAPSGMYTLLRRPFGGSYLWLFKGDLGRDGNAAALKFDAQLHQSLKKRSWLERPQ